MTLELLQLEARSVPSVVTAMGRFSTHDKWGGIFDDWTGPTNAALVERSRSETSGKLGQQHLLAAAGPGGGSRVVSGLLIDSEGDFPIRQRRDFFAFEPEFRGGVNVALGDLTGDGFPELVLAPETAGGPRVRVLEGRTLTALGDFFAYDPGFVGGVSVAIAGDRIITAPGPGGGPHVRYFDLHGADLGGFMAGDPTGRTGCQVAAGDVLYFDGRPEVVTLASDGATHALSVYTLAGEPLNTFPVLSGIAGHATLGVGYQGNPFVPLPSVSAGGQVIAYDPHPGFERVTTHRDYNAWQAVPRETRVGSTKQLDGLARFDLTGGFWSNERPQALTGPLFPGFPLTDVFDRPPGGAAISPFGRNQTGTLAGYVRDEGGTVYGLTNRHVVDTGDGEVLGNVVLQPGRGHPDSRTLGTVAYATSDIEGVDLLADAALIRLADQTAYDHRLGNHRWRLYAPNPEFPDKMGYFPDGEPHFITTHGTGTANRGQLVYAMGIWGPTLGLVVTTDKTVQVRDDGRIFTYVGQTEVIGADSGVGWIWPGYSGSAVITPRGEVVGLAFAGNGLTGLFSPLGAVFAALKFTGEFVG